MTPSIDKSQIRLRPRLADIPKEVKRRQLRRQAVLTP
jgi:hypothetical protein